MDSILKAIWVCPTCRLALNCRKSFINDKILSSNLDLSIHRTSPFLSCRHRTRPTMCHPWSLPTYSPSHWPTLSPSATGTRCLSAPLLQGQTDTGSHSASVPVLTCLSPPGRQTSLGQRTCLVLFLPRTWHNRATDAKFKEKGKEREKLEERNGERGRGAGGEERRRRRLGGRGHRQDGSCPSQGVIWVLWGTRLNDSPLLLEDGCQGTCWRLCWEKRG